MVKKMMKRGQVMIFVILALALVGAIVLFLLIDRDPTIITGDDTNPESFIERCARKAVNEAVDLMMPQGGFTEPDNYKLYDDYKVEYFCEHTGNYKPCINQHPAYINELRQEIKAYVLPRVEQCYQDLKVELEAKQASVTLGELDLNVNLGPDRVYLDVIRDLTISENGETRVFDEFSVQINSPLYNLAFVAIEIASQEAKYCYFEYVGYNILFTRFDIRKFTFSEGTSIYTIKDKRTSKLLNIGIRGCAIPPGL
tara:strand:+ start:14816 stop:15580 length:765 start_codon:yes stop_codon:yes gene_type:complete